MMSARTTPSPKTAALEALIEAHAIELKLPTVKARFRAMAAGGGAFEHRHRHAFANKPIGS